MKRSSSLERGAVKCSVTLGRNLTATEVTTEAEVMLTQAGAVAQRSSPLSTSPLFTCCYSASSTASLHNLSQKVFAIFTLPLPVRQRSIVISVFVWLCLSASVREHISRTTRPICTKFDVHVTYDSCSVLFSRRCNVLCNSGLMDNAIFKFAHNG